MAKKINEEEIKNKIIIILDTGIFRSISQIKDELEEEYEIKVSPQIVKRYLFKLEKEGKIERKNG
jgi:hypothetical protein